MSRERHVRNGALYACHVFCPIILASLFYGVFCTDTMPGKWFSALFPWVQPLALDTNVVWYRLLRWYFADFCWAYALLFALNFVWPQSRFRLAFVAITACVLVCLLEFLQVFSCIPGTFDGWDIVVECMALGIALWILCRKEKRI